MIEDEIEITSRYTSAEESPPLIHYDGKGSRPGTETMPHPVRRGGLVEGKGSVGSPVCMRRSELAAIGEIPATRALTDCSWERGKYYCGVSPN